MTALFANQAIYTSALRFEYGTQRNDPSLQRGPFGYNESFNPDEPYADGGREVDVNWTRSNMFGCQSAINGYQSINDFDSMWMRWEWNWPATGVHRRYQVIGIVYDQNGVGIPGATVQLFNTSTGLLVDTQTTNAQGQYVCGDPNGYNCFVVAYLPSTTPNLEGTTVNNLVGV